MRQHECFGSITAKALRSVLWNTCALLLAQLLAQRLGEALCTMASAGLSNVAGGKGGRIMQALSAIELVRLCACVFDASTEIGGEKSVLKKDLELNTLWHADSPAD
jgi:hypothetical protein